MAARFCTILLTSLLSCLASFQAAHADKSPSIATKEPERFALVIGNGAYRSKNGNWEELLDTCTEAVNFRAKLLAAGWASDHIFPAIKAAPAGSSAEDAIRAAVCDLDNQALSDAVSDFTGTIAANENNPYGVVFYAGHGIESNDEFYAFGIDSWIDLDFEARELDTLPNYTIFSVKYPGRTERMRAVGLTQIVSGIDGGVGKAILLIIDACRNNPELDAYLQHGAHPRAANPNEMTRLAINYINSRPDKYDQSLSRSMFMFSTRPNNPAASGQGGDPNMFSKDLFDYLDKDPHLKMHAAALVVDFESQEKIRQAHTQVGLRQVPQHVGSMPDSPIFCLKGCPQPLTVWKNESIQIISAADAKPAAAPPTPQSVPKTISARRDTPLFKLAAYHATPPLPAASAPVTATPDISAPSATSRSAKPLGFDVFYCAGDSAEAQRHIRAQIFAEGIKATAAAHETEGLEPIGLVRLRSLDLNLNLADGHPKDQNTLVVPRSSPHAQSWEAAFSAPFQKVYADDVTRGAIRAYFCSGVTPADGPKAKIYTQVSVSSQTKQAAAYLNQLHAALPNLNLIPKIEPVDETHPGRPHAPQATEIRYYLPAQKKDANDVAAALRSLLTGPVKVRKLSSSNAALKQNPVIEIWFGAPEMSGWTTVES